MWSNHIAAKPAPQFITILGSYGELVVDRSTGAIAKRYPCSDYGGEYDDIVRFDPVYLQDTDALDIIDARFLDAAGKWIEPEIRDQPGMFNWERQPDGRMTLTAEVQ